MATLCYFEKKNVARSGHEGHEGHSGRWHQREQAVQLKVNARQQFLLYLDYGIVT